MYDPHQIASLTALEAITSIKHRADREAERAGGIGALMAHLEGIWDAFAILAQRIDAVAQTTDGQE